MSTANKWLGVAQSRAEQRVMIPANVKPGSIWLLRVGTRTYSYIYPATIEIGNITDNDRARAVVDGVIAAYDASGGALAGGTDGTTFTLSATLYQGKWAIQATGTSDGAPLDLSLTAQDPTAGYIAVMELQKGRAARNEIQRIEWPGTPTGGNLTVSFMERSTSVAYNASAATLKSALEALASIGSGNVDVTGSYTAGYAVEFKGTFAGTNVEPLVAYSTDATGIASYTIEVIQRAGTEKQTYVMTALSGDAYAAYRFTFQSQEGHIFTGAANAEAIEKALESVPTIGSGNATVVAQDDGTYLITMTGRFVGLDATGLSIESDDGSTAPTLTAGDSPDTTPRRFQQRITFHGMPYTGTYTLSSAGSTTAGLVLNATPTPGAAVTGLSNWLWVSASGGVGEAYTIVIEYQSSLNQTDPPLVIANVGSLIGTLAMTVVTSQTAQSARNEIQQVSVATDPTGGTFTLTFGADTTSGIAYNASAATVQTALQALSSIGSGNALVSGPAGGPWLVEFSSSLAAADQNPITGNGASLTIPSVAAVSSTTLQSPTGPNWWNNVANWSLGHIPTSGEVAVFENCSVPCKYGLSSTVAFDGIDVYRSFTGDGIGLAPIRTDGTPETLTGALTLTDNTSTFALRVGLGEDGNGPTLIRIAAGAQNVLATILFTQQSTVNGGMPCMLSGAIDELTIGSASVGVAVVSGETATLLSVHMRSGTQQPSVLEWGEGATVTAVQAQGGEIRAGSVPKTLYANGTSIIVKGTQTIDSLVARDCPIRWLASGGVGKYGLISAITVDGSSQLLITSNGHGLVDGQRVFVRGFRGIKGIPDAYYTVDVSSANQFSLVGTTPAIPYGASTPGVDNYYEADKAQWGLADSIILSGETVLDFSEIAVVRTCVAPVLIQSDDAVIQDPVVTIQNLRVKYDPGILEPPFGVRCVMMRDEHASATSSPGSAGGSGGLVGETIDPF